MYSQQTVFVPVEKSAQLFAVSTVDEKRVEALDNKEIIINYIN